MFFAAFLVQTIFKIPTLTAAFSPDTNSFYQFSVYRQPLYGLWMASTYKLFGSWVAVKAVQLIVFYLAAIFLARELYLSSHLGRLCAIIFPLILLALGHYGMTNYVASLISEGLFYSLLLVMASLLMRWLRLADLSCLLLLIFICVLTSQLKTAFLPVLGLIVVAFIVLFISTLRLKNKINRTRCLAATLAFFLSVTFFPSILGKDFLQLSTEKNRIGFVIIPRIGSLPTPPDVVVKLSRWSEMTTTWRGSADGLGVLAFTQFDAQLQEATRYHLYTSDISSLLNNESVDISKVKWSNGDGYEQAGELALQWIKHSPGKYFIDSSKHLMGLLFAAPLMTQNERQQISRALGQISSRTWEKVELRSDYPLGDLSKPISTITNLFYISIRVAVSLYLVLAGFALIRMLTAFCCRTEYAKSDVAISISLLSVIALSLAPALTVFPEIRYVYANLIIMFSGLLMFISLLRLQYSQIEPAIV